MKRLLWVVLATLIFSFSAVLGSAELTIVSDKQNPQAGESFTLTATGSISGGIDSIEFINQSKRAQCLGTTPCTAKFTLSESSAGSKTYHFKLYDTQTGTNDITKTFTITIGSTTQDNAPSATTSSNVAERKVTVTGTDDRGVDRITTFLKDMNGNVLKTKTHQCLGSTPCSATFTYHDVPAGTYDFSGKIYDSTVNEASIPGYTLTFSEFQSELTISSSYSPANPAFGEAVEIRINAKTSLGVDSILFIDKNQRYQCLGAESCDAKFTIIPTDLGDNKYAFRVFDADNSEKNHDVIVFVTSRKEPVDNSPTVDAVVPSTVSKGQEFTVSATSTDDLGVDRIEAILLNANNIVLNTKASQCLGVKSCSASFKYKITETGYYKLRMTSYDSTTHQTSKEYSFNTQDSNSGGDSGSGGNTPDTTSPLISLTADKTNPVVEEGVTFTITSSDNVKLDNVNLTVQGNTVTFSQCINVASCSANHATSFGASGTYNIIALARDASGNINSAQVTINVQERSGDGGDDGSNDGGNDGGNGGGGGSGGGSGSRATASFTVSPSTVYTNQEVTFNATSSKARWSSGRIVRYVWDFNGDNRDDLTTESPIAKHTYTTDGSYRVRLRVTDSTGSSASATKLIEVRCCGTSPTASFTDSIFNINVRDKNDRPIEGVTVSMVSQRSIYARNTDANGAVSINVVPECYDITATKEGYDFNNITDLCIGTGETKDIMIKEQGIERKSNITGLFAGAAERLREIFEQGKMVVLIPVLILLAVGITALVLYSKMGFDDEESFSNGATSESSYQE